MKHSNFIAAFDAAAINERLGFGFVEYIGPIFKDINDMCSNIYFAQRKQLEENLNFKQIIPYFVFRDFNGRVFHYQRTSQVGEQRLAGKVSIGIGGHSELSCLHEVDRHNFTLPTSDKISYAIGLSASKEWQEELDFTGSIVPLSPLSVLAPLYDSLYSPSPLPLDYCLTYKPNLIGFINDNSNDVGKVHLGLVYLVSVVVGELVKIKEDELVDKGFQNLSLSSDLEPWSFLVAEHLLGKK